jgi:hypothetical protein
MKITFFRGRKGWYTAIFHNEDGTTDLEHFQPKGAIDVRFGIPLDVTEEEQQLIFGREMAFYVYNSRDTAHGNGLINPDPSNAVPLRDLGIDTDGRATAIIAVLPREFDYDPEGPLSKIIYPANDGSDDRILRASLSNLKHMVGFDFRFGEDREVLLRGEVIGYINGLHETDAMRFVPGSYVAIATPIREEEVRKHELGDVWLITDLVETPALPSAEA